MGRRGAYLAMVVLAGWTAPAGAQGLVITPLPSGQVIEAVAAPMPAPLPDSGPQPPTRPGLPQPSIIVGDLAVLAGFDPRGPLGLAFESRQAIRQRDAGLFERLLGDGAFDPDADRLAEAIQTELRRMACYAGSIDGAWGAGSAGAVRRWSQAAGAEADARPDTGLFRAILRRGELQCPAPATAATQPAATPRAPAARSAPARESRAAPSASRAQQAAPRRQPAPAQQPTPSRQINPSLMGSGLFR